MAAIHTARASHWTSGKYPLWAAQGNLRRELKSNPAFSIGTFAWDWFGNRIDRGRRLHMQIDAADWVLWLSIATLWGIFIYPCFWVANELAGRLVQKGNWAFLALMLILWIAQVAIVIAIFSWIADVLVPLAVRRSSPYLSAGAFLIGLFAGQKVVYWLSEQRGRH
jgi:MFS family permease